MNADSQYAAANAARDALEDSGQALVSAIISDSVLEHVPLVKLGVAAVATVMNFLDLLFEQKLTKFLTALEEVPQEQRLEMITKLETDPRYGRLAGQHIIELLDRVDSHRKPSMIGAVFAAYARGTIGLDLFYRLNDAISRLPIIDIDAVRRFKEAYDGHYGIPTVQNVAIETSFSIQELMNAGLAEVGSFASGLGYSPNRTCEAFLSLNLDLLC